MRPMLQNGYEDRLKQRCRGSRGRTRGGSGRKIFFIAVVGSGSGLEEKDGDGEREGWMGAGHTFRSDTEVGIQTEGVRKHVLIINMMPVLDASKSE